MFPKLEDQMCKYSIDNVRNKSTGSPDRVDALVWGLTEIFEKIAGRRRLNKSGGGDLDNLTTWAEGTTSSSSLTGSDTSWMAG